ncbi:tetratricopeptide repeat-containing glycosyltransferase family 2 protein [Anaerotruncus rubiinfantis]|uniref:tetratricopeptide repeat-containing glycosyltransferase family 2 protein n=1 Tax=Anaerotruncus rubiinfantis TaxID=1720200 RepID=UPI00082DB271|nr:glycosyltransferase [Anaerotruncus rubiinfantis]
MITISLCMIVKNEEVVLGRCLESVGTAADEIIVVDTGSTDRTREIAKAHGARIYDFEWIDDFAAARNFAFEKAGMQYCMWLDADDLLLPGDRDALLRLKQTLDPAVDVVMLRYNTAFGQDGEPTFSYYRERILKNHADFRWEGAVHEAIAPRGRVEYAEIAVTHKKERAGDPLRNLRIYESMLARGRSLVPRERFYYARELYYNARYDDAVRELEAFLRQPEGWIENQLEACRCIAWCKSALGDADGALRALLGAMAYAAPRAELCCEIGRCFFERGDYPTAVFWYELALTRERDDRTGGFVSPDCYGYLPCIQLCICYDRLGDREKAKAYNERAGSYKPDDPSVLYNRAYFAKN